VRLRGRERVGGLAGLRQPAAAGQEPPAAAVEAREQSCDVGVGGRRQPVEAGPRRGRGAREDPIEDQRVEVDVKIGGAPKRWKRASSAWAHPARGVERGVPLAPSPLTYAVHTAMTPLPQALRQWVRALGRDESGEWREHELNILAHLSECDPEDACEGLHELWPLMRHVTREDCWALLPPDARRSPNLRPEIRAFFDRPPMKTPEAVHEYWAESEGERRQLESFARSAREACDAGLEAHLPRLEWHDSDRDSLLDPREASRRFKGGSSSLLLLAPRVEVLVGESDEFWGMLGPVRDALHPEHPEGWENRIAGCRLAGLRRRLVAGTAEVLDLWLLFLAFDAEWRNRAEARLLEIAAQTPTPALEDFLTNLSLVDDRADPVAPEQALREPDRLWNLVLERPDLSQRLLARAGEYYWDRSGFRDGPALPLAALACVHALHPEVGEEVAELLLAAFENAVASEKRQLALDCLNRGLMYLAFDARRGLLTPRALDRVQLNLDSLWATVGRAWDLRRCSPRIPLWYALEGVNGTAIADSRLVGELREMGRRLNVQAVGVAAELEQTLGSELWRHLDEETRALLVLADTYWHALESRFIRSDDYGVVGVHYRRAIEHEWRRRLGAVPGLDPTGTLGELTTKLRELNPIGRAFLADYVGDCSPILNPQFLDDMRRQLIHRYLNPSAHSQGLRREDCENLRTRLLRERQLQRILNAVQPLPGRRQNPRPRRQGPASRGRS
jgi:hypothetical protein